MKRRQRPLGKVLLSILTERLFIPVILLSIGLTVLSAFIASTYINQEQLQTTRSISLRLDDFIRNAREVINSAARVSETTSQSELLNYFETLQQTNPYFDTLYLLDRDGTIITISPPDRLSIGLDMSNQEYYLHRQAGETFNISQPFISNKTGALTVYLTELTPSNKLVVGELSLSKLQQVIRTETFISTGRSVFILDTHLTTIGHPDASMVAQQINYSYLNQDQQSLIPDGKTHLKLSATHSYLQTISTLKQTGWMVVAQTDLLAAFTPFLFFTVLSAALFIALWLLVLYSIQQEANRKVMIPLAQLSDAASSIAAGDKTKMRQIVKSASSFEEIQDLAANFVHMIEAIEQRQTALETRTRSEHELRLLAESLRDTAATLNSTLDFDEVLERILSNIGMVIPHDAADIMLIDSDDRKVHIVAEKGYARLGLQQWINHSTFTLDQFKTLYQMYQTASPILISDTLNDPLWVVIPESNWMKSYIGAPIRVRGQVIGFINLDSLTPGFFNLEMMEKLQSFADQAGIAIHNAELVRDLQTSHQELVVAYNTTIQGWGKALELRDTEIQGHSIRVADTTVRLAQHLGISEPEITYIRYGAFLHDIGKLAIPDSILYKTSALTDEEWEIMRMHPIYAQQILAPIPYLSRSVDIPYYHHEHWDGSGYPHRLRGEQIPLAARIFPLVDVWDSLRCDRPYHSAWEDGEIEPYILSQAGKLFDPHLVEEFLIMLKKDAGQELI